MKHADRDELAAPTRTMYVAHNPHDPTIIADQYAVFAAIQDADSRIGEMLGGLIFHRYTDNRYALTDKYFSADPMHPYFEHQTPAA